MPLVLRCPVPRRSFRSAGRQALFQDRVPDRPEKDEGPSRFGPPSGGHFPTVPLAGGKSCWASRHLDRQAGPGDRGAANGDAEQRVTSHRSVLLTDGSRATRPRLVIAAVRGAGRRAIAMLWLVGTPPPPVGYGVYVADAMGVYGPSIRSSTPEEMRIGSRQRSRRVGVSVGHPRRRRSWNPRRFRLSNRTAPRMTTPSTTLWV